MSDKKIFAEGIWFFPPGVAAPDYVLGSLTVDVVRFKNFMLKTQASDRMRFSIKKARSGNIYVEVNTYDPEGKAPRSKEEEDTQIQYPDAEPTIEIEDVDTSF